MGNEHPIYRKDIDGLRAVAILLVVIYHAFPVALTGGFVGVDVFFVISGFLISSILFRSLERGDFSFSDFYIRRIRRIFPALIVVLASTFAAGWFLLLTDEYKQLGLHIAAGAGFVQNFVLQQEVGYFDVASELKPLVHLWSLSIEEQFYLVFPVLIWGTWKLGLNPLTTVSMLLLTSFGLNVNEISTSSTMAFFMPQTRFWEFLVGATLAHVQLFNARSFANALQRAAFHPLVFRRPPSQERREAVLNDVIAVVGLLLIATAALWVDRTKPYPGSLALLPVFGAAFLILAGPAAWINKKILSSRFMVAIGLISYPLYLWHWPLLSFARIMENEVPTTGVIESAVAASFVLAGATYYLIERPLRFGKHGRMKSLVLVLVAVIVGSVGFLIYENDGLSFRKFSMPFVFEGETDHAEFFKFITNKYYLCKPKQLADESLKWEGHARCFQSKEDADVDIALIGDSHAEHLFAGLAEQLPDKNIAVYLGISPAFLGNPDYANIFKHAMETKSIKKVIFTMHWSRRSMQISRNTTLDKEILKTAGALIDSGKEVYITDDVPMFGFDPKGCKVNRSLSLKSNCTIGIADALWLKNTFTPALKKAVQEDPRIKYLETFKYFCNEKRCSMVNGSEILFRDKNHLNINGSRYLAKRILLEFTAK